MELLFIYWKIMLFDVCWRFFVIFERVTHGLIGRQSWMVFQEDNRFGSCRDRLSCLICALPHPCSETHFPKRLTESWWIPIYFFTLTFSWFYLSNLVYCNIFHSFFYRISPTFESESLRKWIIWIICVFFLAHQLLR